MAKENYSDPCDNGLELKTVQALVFLIIDAYRYTHTYIYIYNTKTYIKTRISLCQLRGPRQPNSNESILNAQCLGSNTIFQQKTWDP